MPTPAEFLKTLGEGLAAYDRHRVAKIGCFTALGLLALIVAGSLAGVIAATPIFPRLFRFVALTMIGGALLVFAGFAAAETLAERRALREIAAFVSGGGADLETLLEMARTRQGRFPGSDRVVDLLERALEERRGGTS
jgi:hypothetical protein